MALPTASTRACTLELDVAVAGAVEMCEEYVVIKPDPSHCMGGPVLPGRLAGLLGEGGCDALKKCYAGKNLNLTHLISDEIPWLVRQLTDELSDQKSMHEIELRYLKSTHAIEDACLRDQVLELDESEGKAWDDWMEMNEEKHILSEKVRELEEKLGQEKAAKAALHAVHVALVEMYALRDKY